MCTNENTPSVNSPQVNNIIPIHILNAGAASFIPTAKAKNVNTHNINELPLDDVFSICEVRKNYINNIILAHININSIRNKFEMLCEYIRGNVDLLLISETKIDESFPSSQFHIPGFSTPFRRDRSCNGGGLLLYIREDIPAKIIESTITNNDLEFFMVEFNLFKMKWLIGCSYNPHKNMISNHLNAIGIRLDEHMQQYDNIILIGDFNCEPHEIEISDFCDIYGLKNLVKEPTCFKSTENPTLIDLILTNKSQYFQKTRVIEAGLSDFHKMVLTVMKTKYKKQPPKLIIYRDFKNFSNINFRCQLDYILSRCDINGMSNDEFINTFLTVFDKHAPLKKKYMRANEGPFVTKEIRKAIMFRSKLANTHYRTNSKESKVAYNKQRNVCTHLVRKAKREYYKNLQPSNITDSKGFWKTVKPLFSDKAVSTKNITLIEDNHISQDDKDNAEIFNKFFGNAVKSLNIEIKGDILNINTNEKDQVLRAIKMFENHPSILKIREHNEDQFCFKQVSHTQVHDEIFSLNLSKAIPKESIPPKIIKENHDLFTPKIHNDINQAIISGEFPNNLKLADVTPAHKKGDRTDKCNYRPVSLLSSLSKLFERILFYQINEYMDKKLSMYLCGFRSGYSSQYCLLMLIEKWRSSLDKHNSSGILLTDLSKAFDSLNHDLLIAKLDAYGFDYISLKLVRSYLTNRHQRVSINSSYSEWDEILCGVPQGSILGPLLFNIYLNDLFMFCENSDIANYADDNSPYANEKEIELVTSKLKDDSEMLLNWVSQNALKANPDKFHMILSDDNNDISIFVDGHEIINSPHKKLLGVSIDRKLSFDVHISSLCTKASQKLHALARVARYMNMDQRRNIMKAFITSQFGYCPLIWMIHNKSLNNKINKIHERALRIVFSDYRATFTELLERDKSVTIHERNIKVLATELYKVVNGLAPKILEEVFQLKESIKYNSKFPFQTFNVRTTTFGTDSLSYLGPKIWSILPNCIKESKCLEEFKMKIKPWKPRGCPCRICKTYIQGVGYIN